MGILKLKSKFTGSVRGEDAGLGSKMGSIGGIGLNSNRMELSSEVRDLPVWICWGRAAQPLITAALSNSPQRGACAHTLFTLTLLPF